MDDREGQRQQVVLLQLNGAVLDTFKRHEQALETAEHIMTESGLTWVPARPDRWWSERGTLAIVSWTMKE